MMNMFLKLFLSLYASTSVTFAWEATYYTDGEICYPCPWLDCQLCFFVSDFENNSTSLRSVTEFGSTVCALCPSECKSYNSSQMCLKCKPGFRGQVCKDRCSYGCSDGTCDKDTGSCPCKTGYFGYTCTNTCPWKCEACHSHSDCTVCIPGYFGEQCAQQCSSNCMNGDCDRNGTCYSCVDGYYGNGCVLMCPDKCDKKCNVDDMKPMCQQNCTNCKLKQSCDFVTGECDSCKDGFYGRFCNETCSKQCRSCSTSGDICIRCSIGWYGIHNDNKTYACDKRCNENCFNRSCDAVNGSCNVGCNTGLWGQYCENTCSDKCKNPGCNRDNGTCSNACMDGFYGSFCENKEKGFPLTFVGLIIAMIVIIAVITTFVVVAVKARQHRHATVGEESVVNDGIEIIQLEYEDLIRNQEPVYYTDLQIVAQEENQTTHDYEELTTMI